MKLIIKAFLMMMLLKVLTLQAATPVTNIAQGCWANHSLFLKSDGSLWGMGLNSSSQLGLNIFYGSYDTPQEIVASNVTVMAAGGAYSLFLKSDVGAIVVMFAAAMCFFDKLPQRLVFRLGMLGWCPLSF